jgi:hypothetical protein
MSCSLSQWRQQKFSIVIVVRVLRHGDTWYGCVCSRSWLVVVGEGWKEVEFVV